jgi:CDGSH-type Zn-finger protein/truncated hemoglobin YjbI
MSAQRAATHRALPAAGEQELADALRRAQALRASAEMLAGATPDGAYAGFASRLEMSVTRPLQQAIDRTSSAARPSRPDTTASDALQPEQWDVELWALTRDATALRARADDPLLNEAVAALQDLARTSAADDATRRERLATLFELMRSVAPEIVPARDGPYLVSNPERLEDWLGVALQTTPQMALCRCGASRMKPLCDGHHATSGFSGAKDPARVPDRRDEYVGQQITVLDDRGTCQHSAYCTDRLATVFHLGEEPFATPSGGRMDEIIRAVRDCPSGALSYAIDGVEARAEVDYHGRREPAIQISKDGPYRVVGGLALNEPDTGEPVPRNEVASLEHYALCRCGRSQNKPFCSGMHWNVEFHDPVAADDHVPSMFEWCGGLPTLTRMTRLFYEKHVPQDPMLGPLFANMSADHPQRVAKWLAEVFGGPAYYSEEYGGYPRMLSQHLGRCLTEEWRARWVELLMRSADEAGLPNDAEFRSAFEAYIAWGSRLAVENSQTGAKPPERMPMPHWDWYAAAGPPGSRISALAATSEPPEQPVVLPAADEPVRYEKHIRQLFRERDQRSMRFAFDLHSHADVREHAQDILARVQNGTMPCDGAWQSDWVDTFARWVEQGCLA